MHKTTHNELLIGAHLPQYRNRKVGLEGASLRAQAMHTVKADDP